MREEIGHKKGFQIRVSKTIKEDNIKINENEFKENLKGIEREIIRKRKLPEEENLKINKKIFENLIISIVIMVFLYFISLGSLNIDSEVFLTDLKVFSLMLCIFTIVLFEQCYRKENVNLCIHGIECFVLALFVLVDIYLYAMYLKDFDFIVTIASISFAIYYVAKSIVIYLKMRKMYFASINDINDIIKK